MASLRASESGPTISMTSASSMPALMAASTRWLPERTTLSCTSAWLVSTPSRRRLSTSWLYCSAFMNRAFLLDSRIVSSLSRRRIVRVWSGAVSTPPVGVYCGVWDTPYLGDVVDAGAALGTPREELEDAAVLHGDRAAGERARHDVR